MNDIAISVENLSKSYSIGHNPAQAERYATLRDVIVRSAKTLVRKTRDMCNGRAIILGDDVEEFWALRGVSFEIKQGERVGIIGRNGAGKSTLLKILSRITEPTDGCIKINGRVASLLEVGTGFHPELTGRENIFLNGAILGMSRADIRSKFDEIVDFAEVSRFLDTPVKRYSSGMYVRLAFSVAAHLNSDILIIDEVLAVGDVRFQKKCLGKMGNVAGDGRTVLFVSHNMAAIQQLTQSCIVLQAGLGRFYNPASAAVEAYLKDNADNKAFYDVSKTPRTYLGTQQARFLSFQFSKQPPSFFQNESIEFAARIHAFCEIDDARISLTIFGLDGTPIGSCFGDSFGRLEKGTTNTIEVSLPAPGLAPGSYYLGISIGHGSNTTGNIDHDVVLETLYFDVYPENGEDGTLSHWSASWGALILPKIKQTVIEIRDA